jgi:hypothetical protein
VGLGRWVPRARSGCQEETSGQPIELGPAEHLALEQLQAVDVPFDGALAPGQGHGCHVGPEPFGKATKGREGAPGGARQPRFKVCGLAPADEGGAVLCERYGLRQLGQLGRLRGQLRQLLVILGRRPRRRTEDQPGRSARREPVPWRLRYRR